MSAWLPRWRPLTLSIVMAIVLVACGSTPPPVETWVGTSTHDDQSDELILEFSRTGAALVGTYVVGYAEGLFTGVLEGDTLSATLVPSENCSYGLSGTMTDTTIEAAYAPDDCPGGDHGTWSLTRP